MRRPTPEQSRRPNAVIPAQANEKPPFRKRGVGGIRPHPAITKHPPPPPPSFQRRPESRIPTVPGVGIGRGVDSRFRGNDGMGAGMMMGLGVSYGVGWRTKFLPHPTLSRWERAGAWRPYQVGRFIQRWLPYIVGAPGRAPLRRITKPAPPSVLSANIHTYIHTTQPASTVIPALPSVIPAKAGIQPGHLKGGANRGSGFRPAPE